MKTPMRKFIINRITTLLLILMLVLSTAPISDVSAMGMRDTTPYVISILDVTQTHVRIEFDKQIAAVAIQFLK